MTVFDQGNRQRLQEIFIAGRVDPDRLLPDLVLLTTRSISTITPSIAAMLMSHSTSLPEGIPY